MQEVFGDLRGLKVSWIGDGNNVCHSYLEAAGIFGFDLIISAPKGYEPASEWVEKADGHVSFVDTPEDAARHAQVITTDVWASMGQESEASERLKAFDGYQITSSYLILRPITYASYTASLHTRAKRLQRVSLLTPGQPLFGRRQVTGYMPKKRC